MIIISEISPGRQAAFIAGRDHPPCGKIFLICPVAVVE
jgi:hypothetical protein